MIPDNIQRTIRHDTNSRNLRDFYSRLRDNRRTKRPLPLGKGSESTGSDGERGKETFGRYLARMREYLKRQLERDSQRSSVTTTLTITPVTVATSKATITNIVTTGNNHAPDAVAEPITQAACEVETTMLCKNCLKFNFNRQTLDPDYRPGGLDVNAVFTEFGNLVKSSGTCPLCKLILEGLETNFANGTQVPVIGLELPVGNQGSLKNRVGEDSKVFVSIWTEDETTISFFIIPPEIEHPRHPIPRLTESNLRVYSEIGDWARPPPLTPWSEPCIDRLKHWLNECLKFHRPQCCTMRSGKVIDESLPPVLPSRVIDVGPLDGSGGARLLESNGKRAFYTALSYCWGSSGKDDRPYLTTTKTLEKHLSQLPWDLLPNTLQDAILLTRKIGVRYLWINSLCIIQDSNADWEKEAATMGTVYAQARLVIAATTGADAEASLFPFQAHIHRPSEISPSLYFTKLPKERGSRQHNLPLFTRGWATQEWVLARRIVFWTQDRMCWYCANKCAGDDGKDVSTTSGLFERYTTWKEIVARYSGRHLTYAKDKLIALQGVVNEIQTTRPGDKYVYGSWMSELHWELLWSGQALPLPDSGLKDLQVPSWSWISHPGGVQFLEDPERGWGSWEASAQSSVSLLEDSLIQIVARSMTVDLCHPDMVCYCFRWFRHENGEVSYHEPDLPTRANNWNIFTICSPEVGHNTLQIALRERKTWVVFDTRYFLDKYRKEHHGLGVCADISDEFSFVEVVKNRWYPFSAGLLLRRSPHTSGRWIRVGLGFAFHDWLGDAERGRFIVE